MLAQNSIGGYDDGYKQCPCFWGESPGSLLQHVPRIIGDLKGKTALDAGCGEGKNAAFLASQGMIVDAVDVSAFAIGNGKTRWGELKNIRWFVDDITHLASKPNAYDVIVAYGLYHCIRSQDELTHLVNSLKGATRPGGIHVVCAFNARSQDLSAHPGFHPLLVPDAELRGLYADWHIDLHTDSDLTETHPHNGITHTHSMTRIIAVKRG